MSKSSVINSKQMARYHLETHEQAKERNEAKIITFWNSGDKKLANISEKMMACKPHNPCGLLACSVCLRHFRYHYLKRYTGMWFRLYQKCPVYYVTAVLRVPVNAKKMPLNDFKMWAKKHFKQYGFDKVPLMGGVDYSVNIDETYNRPYICQHLHFLIAMQEPKAFTECLKRAFPVGENVARPVRVDAITDREGLQKALNYTIPAFFEKRWRKLINERHRTKHYPLGNKQLCELYRFLATNKPKDLMFSQNISNQDIKRFRK